MRIALGTGAAFAASGAWYTLFSARLAHYDETHADTNPSPVQTMLVELARSATVATAVTVLSKRLQLHTGVQCAALGAGLWAAFPAVLLTGSVVHENVPWQQAAIHAGDWLIKLLLIAMLAGVGREHRTQNVR